MRWATATIGGGAAIAAFALWVRPWGLHWGATEDEVQVAALGDELVSSPHFDATRAVSIRAPAEQVWPWLVQIGRGRAGWYSYDRLDNEGHPSARTLIPAFQHMDLGDVVPMMIKKTGEPFGPSVLALDPPHVMLWGDTEDPHRFTWLWWLREDGTGETRLITRVRCRYSIRDPMTALVMEFADTIMMRRCMLNIGERAEAAAAIAPEEPVEARTS